MDIFGKKAKDNAETEAVKPEDTAEVVAVETVAEVKPETLEEKVVRLEAEIDRLGKQTLTLAKEVKTEMDKLHRHVFGLPYTPTK